MQVKICTECYSSAPLGAQACTHCGGSVFDVYAKCVTSAPKIVACKACGSVFDLAETTECTECGKLYVPSALELLGPQSPAQREAVEHAERIRSQFTAQERALADAHLTTTSVYRPLPVWKQRLFAFARGIRTWVTKTRGRKDRTP